MRVEGVRLRLALDLDEPTELVVLERHLSLGRGLVLRNARDRQVDLGVGALLGGLLAALPGLGVGRLLARALVVQRVHL